MNGYPDHVIEKTIAHKLKDFTSPISHRVKKILSIFISRKSNIKASAEKSFFAVKQRVTFTSRPLLPAIKKDVLPALLLSNVVCNFLCHVIAGM